MSKKEGLHPNTVMLLNREEIELLIDVFRSAQDNLKKYNLSLMAVDRSLELLELECSKRNNSAIMEENE